MDLSNVIDAIERAKTIMQKNQENPSLSAWEAIEKIFSDCKLL